MQLLLLFTHQSRYYNLIILTNSKFGQLWEIRPLSTGRDTMMLAESIGAGPLPPPDRQGAIGPGLHRRTSTLLRHQGDNRRGQCDTGRRSWVRFRSNCVTTLTRMTTTIFPWTRQQRRWGALRLHLNQLTARPRQCIKRTYGCVFGSVACNQIAQNNNSIVKNRFWKHLNVTVWDLTRVVK